MHKNLHEVYMPNNPQLLLFLGGKLHYYQTSTSLHLFFLFLNHIIELLGEIIVIILKAYSIFSNIRD